MILEPGRKRRPPKRVPRVNWGPLVELLILVTLSLCASLAIMYLIVGYVVDKCT